MDNNKKQEILERITGEIAKIEKNEQKFLFFVADTKGKHNATLTYVYEMALLLNEMGYTVNMLYSEKEFMGVESWLGEKYAKLPHFNIDSDKVNIAPSDFLFIPEIFTSVMYQTKKLPCKRIAIVTNYEYMMDVIQPGASWESYNIKDCITMTETLAKRINELFPTIKTRVVKPYIQTFFDAEGLTKKPFINVLSKNQSDVNMVVKPFFLKYPMYKWVGFRDIKGLSREEFADALKESFATVWVDERNDFGYSVLEAMACDNVIIAKVPNDKIDWAYDNDGNLKDNAVWFYDTRDVHSLLASLIQTYLIDNIPNEIYENMKETLSVYTRENTEKDIKDVIIDTYVKDRLKDMNEALLILKNNTTENTEEQHEEN